ncbi:MAG: class I poly(R)-hydroxyalkanoic acid synthase [Alphaproteobacteria bacterium]|nr:class I poly(R)-hydroxyalkanoic acid synthase [Alphaproteobacteria bacterium]
MTDRTTDIKLPDPEALARNWVRIASRSQELVMDFARSQAGKVDPANPDPLNLANAFVEMTGRMMANPMRLVEAQMELWRSYAGLWQSATMRWLGHDTAPAIEADPADRRFKDQAWRENAIFDFIKQSYLLSAQWVQKQVQTVEGLDDRTARKIEFYTRQMVDAMAPSNFVLTNPEVLKATFDSSGENLVKGLDNMLADLRRGDGQLMIKMTDLDKFKVGVNVAVTHGKVVAETPLMQLIQYAPSTEKVLKRPLLIVPPWINKFYILDLRPDNSFIKWAVDQGHSVFVVSWVNPDRALADKTFEDYMHEGLLAALDAVETATGEAATNVIGYCLGGTLLGATLGWLKAKGEDKRIASATYFVAMVDFAEAGDLLVFIDEEQLKSLEAKMEKEGVLDAKAMATTFNMLRANDLIWSFVVNNYLLGKEPFPFDLLYWNSDSTRMPRAMHRFYLRKMYQENRLSKPGGVTLSGRTIDLHQIDTPTMLIATKEDHIAPWRAVYRATQIYRGETRFLLAGSGHIAGVVNPPAAKKYGYWTNAENPAEAQDWLASATAHAGSWWPEWNDWIAKRSDSLVPARKPGGGKLKPIEDAPGRYVKVRAV